MSKSYSLAISPETTSSFDGQSNDLFIDLKTLVSTVYRRIGLILIGFLLTFSAVVYYTITQTPIYKSSAVVIVDSKELNVIDLGSVLGNVAPSTAVIDTEVKIIGSKNLLEKVAVQENLIEDPEFNASLRPQETSLLGGIKTTVAGWFTPKPASDTSSRSMTDEEHEKEQLAGIVGQLQSQVSVSRVGTTYLINVEVRSTSPETAANLANKIADQYRVEQLDAKMDATRLATEWLSERVEVMRADVTEKENKVEEYRSRSNLLSANGSTLTERSISDLTQQKITLQAELNQARARYNNVQRAAQSASGVDTIAEVLDSPVINDLKSQRAAILRRLAELSTTYGPRHPELVSVKSEAADIEAQIRTEVNRIVANLESEEQVARDKLGTVNALINQSRSQLVSNNKSLVGLRELERDADTSRVLLDEFEARFQQTSQQDGLIQADARIMSSASIPKNPATPRTFLNILLGALLGGIVGGGLALLAEIFDNKISSARSVDRDFGVPAIGSIPIIKNQGLLGISSANPSKFLVEHPLSAYAESIRYLRAAITFSDIDSQTKVVAVTSSLPDEGKSTLTLSLGRMASMSGSRTLVIDGDFRRRQLTEMAEMDPKHGFIEHLFGEGTLDETIVRDAHSNLDILPLTREGYTPHDVFGTRAYDQLMDQLRERYDLILIDTGPLLLMAEARVVAGKADKTVLVARWRSSSKSTVRQALGLLSTFKADVLGIALNMVDLTQRRQHGEPGTSYRAFRKYYTSEPKSGLFSSINFGRSSGPKARPLPEHVTRPVRDAKNEARETEHTS